MSRDTSIEFSTELLRKLHRIHRQRADLQSRLERGPRQIKAGEALIAKAAAEVTTVKEQIKKNKMTADEKQLTLKGRENRVAELNGKLNVAASNKEFSLIKDQIAADEKANEVLADEIFETLEKIDALNEQLKAAQQELEQQEAEHKNRVAEVTEKHVSLLSEQQRVEQELLASEAEIPTAVRADYKRIVDAKGEEGLAPVDGESCGGCNQTLTTQMRDRLQLSHLVRCPSCNAFLYLPEDLRSK